MYHRREMKERQNDNESVALCIKSPARRVAGGKGMLEKIYMSSTRCLAMLWNMKRLRSV